MHTTNELMLLFPRSITPEVSFLEALTGIVEFQNSEFQKVTFLWGGKQQDPAHSTQAVLQSLCPTSINFGKGMHRSRQKDQILNLRIVLC